ncbi:MAG: glycosyltransferase family 4 protein [Candidatus Levybacteria bacterium]|nr:glycosyltransferase family 4 protein [Candidatus Levybacteria bacterium]
MRIGIDCRLWDETGIGRYTRNLVLNLQEIDKKNEYVLFILSKDYENIKKNWKLEIARFAARRGNWKLRPADVRWHTLEEQLKFPQILNRENLDLMHFPYQSVPVFYNLPFVITIHDLIINHFPSGQASTLPFPIYNLKLLGYKFVMSRAARKAKKIIAVSNATKEEIVDHLGVSSNKVIVTHEGASELKNWKLEIGNWKLKNFSAEKFFLYVGNAYPHKNLERLLEAFYFFCHPESISGSQLNRDSDLRQNDTKLVLVGKEDYFYKRLKKKVASMNLSEKVIFLQNVSDGELADLYKNALALIMPSLMEGFGLPALEAMVNKCLVLASDIPALKEVCGDSAIYFNPYDVKNIAQKIREVCFNDLNHQSRKKEEGLERAKLFSWRKMAKQTLSVYEQVVTSP